MSDKALAVSNYDAIRALSRSTETVDRFIEVLGSGPQGRSFIASAMLVVANSKDLQECTPASIFNSAMRAAALRLSCDPSTKQAHLVPFWNNKTGRRECQFIPGYVGIQNLALRTEKYRYMNPGRVYEGQTMEFDQLTGAARFSGQKLSDSVVGYFHYFELYSGYSHTTYMSVTELREYGQKHAPKNPMWRDQFDSMALKTVTKQNLLKHGILDQTARVILEEASEELQDGQLIDGEFTEDDTQAAVIEAENAPAQPKKSEAELMSGLGFDTGNAKAVEIVPAVEATPPIVETTQELGGVITMTREEAEATLNSKGQRYGDIDSDTLEGMVHGINKGMQKPGADVETYTRKLKAIGIILAARENDDEAARQAENE